MPNSPNCAIVTTPFSNVRIMDEILQFLYDQNRPYTINNIMEGFNKQLSKSQVVSAVNKLVEKNKVIEKNCGKQKIYCVPQKSSLPLKDLTSKTFEMERQCSNLAATLKTVQNELEEKSARLRDLEGTLSKVELLEKKKKLEEEVEEMESKLEGGTSESLDKEKIEREYRTVFKEYNKRKRWCTDMIEAIFENYPKSKKTLLEDIGIETDDDVNFKVKVSIK
ncbi:homologous-pairing protein 2 homolog isoform X1 [Tribolium castaneum]|uniref:homologous-pairing protein 2 homolog isoform X1 n=1 Tax=Tribolium castaneum TaxID=7070 RepID=UPI00077D9C65|nr:PREDICTED: homologous-pairing protein 2 homolog isoform X1 [Tribolium castaneum]|eukprot:XP_015837252.1 PREDICTED: homologous-pairing protein 2 homolog isoform X1 [Tribolium castaneum]